LTRELLHPIERLDVLLPDSGLEVESPQLVPGGARWAEGGSYLNYVGRGLEPGQTLDLCVRVSGAASEQAVPVRWQGQVWLWILLGGIAMAVILVISVRRGRARAAPRSVSTGLAAVVGLVLLALVAFGLRSPDSGRPQPGDLAPGFTLTLFDGSEVSLADLRGQTVVLHFWASWCAPCRREAPALQEIWKRYRDRGVVFVGVAYQDAEGASEAFIREFGITHANGMDDMGRISGAYGVEAVPETFVIDRDGQVVWVRVGELTGSDLVWQLERIVS
jgi:cytochrome c biogenesis protein CcmG/thiol:disulfide interchange protein DsbE